MKNLHKRKPSWKDDAGSLLLKNKDDHSEEKFSSAEDSAEVEFESGSSAQDIEDDKKLSNRLVTHGLHLVKGKMDHGMEDYIVAESDFWTNPKRAIKRAYKVTDDEILERVVSSRGGSTAVTAILINGEKLVVGNVGDSRAIIWREDSVEQIRVDHEPQKERSLVESRGGFVSKISGSVPRVDGQLAMARAFGDEKLKGHITSESDVAVVMIDTDVEFIILASVMSNQAADCIREVRDAQEATEELIKQAFSRGSHDDISCIVVAFH